MPQQINDLPFKTAFTKLVSTSQMPKWPTSKPIVNSILERKRRHYETITKVNELIIEKIQTYLINQTNFFLKGIDETSQLANAISKAPQMRETIHSQSKALKIMTDEYVTNACDSAATISKCYSEVMPLFMNCLTADMKEFSEKISTDLAA